MLLKVGLTGGIASGKSVVGRILKNCGCSVHEADRAGHTLIKPDSPPWREIVARFGPQVLNPDRTVNRPRLGAIIFSRKGERLFLNHLLHPLLLQKIRASSARVEKRGRAKIFVSVAALLIEWKFSDFFDRTVVVHCPPHIQIRRLMERDGITRAQAGKKIRSQMPAQQKLGYADYVLDTSGTLEETERKAVCLYRCLLRDYEKKFRISGRRQAVES